MSYRADCAEIWEIVAEKRAAQGDRDGMRTAVQNRQIILDTQALLSRSARTPSRWYPW